MPTFLFESTTSPVPPTVRSEEKRLVDEAVVEKRLVVVAEVPVALMKVKFWRVEEPVVRRLERVVRPPVTLSVPVKLAEEEIVWSLIRPEVIGPAVRVPMLPEVEKRLVDEAVVEKRLVVVAEVVVELSAMKPPVKVEEAVERKPLRKPRVVEVETP